MDTVSLLPWLGWVWGLGCSSHCSIRDCSRACQVLTGRKVSVEQTQASSSFTICSASIIILLPLNPELDQPHGGLSSVCPRAGLGGPALCPGCSLGIFPQQESCEGTTDHPKVGHLQIKAVLYIWYIQSKGASLSHAWLKLWSQSHPVAPTGWL